MIKNLFNKDYEVIDAKEMITIADSFATNKIGTGHGEGKLYVGQLNDETKSFWDNFENDTYDCFLIKKDLLTYMQEAQYEFANPSQPYQNPRKLADNYFGAMNYINNLPDNELIKFTIFKSPITPPRVYMNSDDDVYHLLRHIGIVNIAYLSILKLKDSDEHILYYFRMFIDYDPDVLAKREYSEEDIEEEVKTDSNITPTEKEIIIKARKGQGKYREKLLEECPYCPITLVNDERLLIASHIKPWAAPGITNAERIDHKNGIPLTPTYDKLFDRGFISFTDDKKLMVSPWLSPMNQKRLNIIDGKIVSHLILDNKRKVYLAYHRENIFKK